MSTVVAVVGTIAGAGTTTAVTALGTALGEQRRRVALVDAVEEGSRIADAIDLSGDGDVTDALRRGAAVGDVQTDGPHDLAAFPAESETSWGSVRPDAVDGLYEQLRERFEIVLVDCGTSLSPARTAWLGNADEVAIVTDPDVAGTVPETVAIADAFDVPVRGVLANRVPPKEVADAIDALADVEPPVLGILPEDPTVGLAAESGASVLRTEPDSPIATCAWELALRFRHADHDEPVVPTGTLPERDGAGGGAVERDATGSDAEPDGTGSDDDPDGAESDADPDGTGSDDDPVDNESDDDRDGDRDEEATSHAAEADDTRDGGSGTDESSASTDSPGADGAEPTVAPPVGESPSATTGATRSKGDDQSEGTATTPVPPADGDTDSEDTAGTDAEASGVGGFEIADPQPVESDAEAADSTTPPSDTPRTGGRDDDVSDEDGGDDGTLDGPASEGGDPSPNVGESSGGVSPAEPSEAPPTGAPPDEDDRSDPSRESPSGVESAELTDEEIEAVFQETMQRVTERREAEKEGDRDDGGRDDRDGVGRSGIEHSDEETAVEGSDGEENEAEESAGASGDREDAA